MLFRSIGLEHDAIWFGVDIGLSTTGFKWYQGNTKIMELSRNANLTIKVVNTSNIKFDDATVQSTAFRYDLLNVSFDVANSAYSNVNATLTLAQAAFDRANLSNDMLFIESAYDNANAAYDKANSANVLAYNTGIGANAYADTVGISGNNYAGVMSNAAGTIANAAFGLTNTIYNAVNSAFDVVNSAFDVANAAYGNANNLSVSANNYAGVMANSANGYANDTFLKLTGGEISGDLSITGNISVTGNTSYINVTNYTVVDSLIYLANTNYTSDIVEIGFVGNYNNGACSTVHTGLFRSPSNKEYYLFQGYDKEPEGNYIDPTGNNISNAVLNADLITSNLNLGGANAIIWIDAAYYMANIAYSNANQAGVIANAAFDVANTKLANTSGVYFAGDLYFPSGNVIIGTTSSSNNSLELSNGVFYITGAMKKNTAPIYEYNGNQYEQNTYVHQIIGSTYTTASSLGFTTNLRSLHVAPQITANGYLSSIFGVSSKPRVVTSTDTAPYSLYGIESSAVRSSDTDRSNNCFLYGI